MPIDESPRFQWPIPGWDVGWQQWQPQFLSLIYNMESTIFGNMEAQTLVMKELPLVETVEVAPGEFEMQSDGRAVFISRTLQTEIVVPEGEVSLLPDSILTLQIQTGAVGEQTTDWECVQGGINKDPSTLALGYVTDTYDIIWFNGSIMLAGAPLILFGGGAGSVGGLFEEGTGVKSTQRRDAGLDGSAAYSFLEGRDNVVHAGSAYSIAFMGGASGSSEHNIIGSSDASPYSFAAGKAVHIDDSQGSNTGFNFGFGYELTIDGSHNTLYGEGNELRDCTFVMAGGEGVEVMNVRYGFVLGAEPYTDTYDIESVFIMGENSGLEVVGDYQFLFGSECQFSDTGSYGVAFGDDQRMYGPGDHTFMFGEANRIEEGGVEHLFCSVWGLDNTLELDSLPYDVPGVSFVYGVVNYVMSNSTFVFGQENVVLSDPAVPNDFMFVSGKGNQIDEGNEFSVIFGRDHRMRPESPYTFCFGYETEIESPSGTGENIIFATASEILGDNIFMVAKAAEVYDCEACVVLGGLHSLEEVVGSVSIGVMNEFTAGGDSSFAGGYGNQMSGAWSFAYGDSHVVTGSASAAFGVTNEVRSNAAFALGEANRVHDDNDFTFVMGSQNVIGEGAPGMFSGEFQTVIGEDCSLYDFPRSGFSFIQGDSHTVFSGISFIVGETHEIGIGVGNTVFGKDNQIGILPMGLRFGSMFSSTHTGPDDSADLVDTTMSAYWSVDQWAGFYILNNTNGGLGQIISNTSTTIVATLSGGQDWDIGDNYVIFEESPFAVDHCFVAGEYNRIKESGASEFATIFGTECDLGGYLTFACGEDNMVHSDYCSAFGSDIAIEPGGWFNFVSGYDIALEAGCHFNAVFGEQNSFDDAIEYNLVSGGGHSGGGTIAGNLIAGMEHQLEDTEACCITGINSEVADANDSLVCGAYHEIAYAEAMIVGGTDNIVYDSRQSLVIGEGHEIEDLRGVSVFGEGNEGISIEYSLFGGGGNMAEALYMSAIFGESHEITDASLSVLAGEGIDANEVEIVAAFGGGHFLAGSYGSLIIGETNNDGTTLTSAYSSEYNFIGGNRNRNYVIMNTSAPQFNGYSVVNGRSNHNYCAAGFIHGYDNGLGGSVDSYFNVAFGISNVIGVPYANLSPGGSHSMIFGQCDGPTSATVMADGNHGSWTVDIWAGFYIVNVTDGSTGLITSNTAYTVTCSGGLSGGVDDQFEAGDAYYITTNPTPDAVVHNHVFGANNTVLGTVQGTIFGEECGVTNSDYVFAGGLVHTVTDTMGTIVMGEDNNLDSCSYSAVFSGAIYAENSEGCLMGGIDNSGIEYNYDCVLWGEGIQPVGCTFSIFVGAAIVATEMEFTAVFGEGHDLYGGRDSLIAGEDNIDGSLQAQGYASDGNFISGGKNSNFVIDSDVETVPNNGNSAIIGALNTNFSNISFIQGSHNRIGGSDESHHNVVFGARNTIGSPYGDLYENWYSGTFSQCTNGAPSATVMDDTSLNNWTVDVWVGWYIVNITDGSTGLITSNAAKSITCSGGLSGGTNDDFEAGDVYYLTANLSPDPVLFNYVFGRDNIVGQDTGLNGIFGELHEVRGNWNFVTGQGHDMRGVSYNIVAGANHTFYGDEVLNAVFGQGHDLEGATHNVVGGEQNSLVDDVNHNAVFGSENSIEGGGHHIVSGELNQIDGCDYCAVFGRDNELDGDYNLVAGYAVSVQGWQNLVVGEGINLYDSGDRGNSVVGTDHELDDAEYNAVGGEAHTLPGAAHNAVFGLGHTLEDVAFNAVFGSDNEVLAMVEWCVVGGNANTLEEEVFCSAAFGSQNTLGSECYWGYALGQYNRVSGQYCFAVGYGNYTDNTVELSTVFGRYGEGKWYGSIVNSGNTLAYYATTPNDRPGQSQNVIDVPFSGVTGDTAWTEIFPDGYGGDKELDVSPHESISGKAIIVARRREATQTRSWEISFLVGRDGAGNTTLINSTQTLIGTTSTGNESTWDCRVSVDDTDDTLQVEVKGNTSEGAVIYWQASMHVSQVCTNYDYQGGG